MKYGVLVLTIFAPFFNLAQTILTQQQKMTTIINNKGDFLYATIYLNPNKETVLLLHGGPGFPSDLTEVVDELKNNYQVITFHQRGTKRSPCKSNDYSMQAYLSDINCITEYYGITKFHLWGHSWGGLYAQIYAAKFSENLLSLFLCCPGSGTNYQWKQTEKEVMALNKLRTTNWEWMKMGMNSLLGRLGSDAAFGRLFRQVMINYNKGFIPNENPAIDFTNLKASPINKTRPEIIKYPVLEILANPMFKITIVYGDQDIYQSSKEFVVKRYPTATVHTIKNCGHIPWLHNIVDYSKILQNHYN